MALLVLTVPADILEIVEETPTDRSYVYEDLLHLHSKSQQLPAASIYVANGRALVHRGAIFVRVAKALQRPIRTVVDQGRSDTSLHEFLERSEVRKLGAREIEAGEPSARAWHAFRFERSLTEVEKGLFIDEICGFFESLGSAAEPISSVRFDDAERRAEFRSITPLGSPEMYGDLLARCRNFSAQYARIVTYQGRRFESYEA